MPRMKLDTPAASPPLAKLLDTIVERMHLKNDAALSRLLKVAPPVISKLRTGRLALGAAMILSMHENADMAVAEIRQLSRAAESPV
jgi:plasmid maintenance system antidote protein VapI